MDAPHGPDIDYDALRRLLAPAPGPAPSRGAGPSSADRTAAGELAVSVLRAVAEGRWSLAAVRHPLGFLCLPVLRDGARGVCVHLFGAGTGGDGSGGDGSGGDGSWGAGSGGDGGRGDAPLVHAHSWSLVSLVLFGRVTNHSVRVVDDPVAPTHRVYEVRSGPDGTDEVRGTTRFVRGIPDGSGHSTTGDVYVVRPGEFHATVVADGRPAATLVLGETQPGSKDMSLGRLSGEGHRSVREICGREETVVAVRAALRRIDEADG
ncbi:hypothetical protein [Streptomyces rhizosphaericola]|uniref:hypothetical protein n=1 Tax=Streptomyces rhizosphaericola TaxID=2564098 RepID=UPI003BF55744